MPLEDKQARRLVERELAKHPIDTSLMTVSVINHIAYLGGRASPLRGALGRGVDIKRELQLVTEAISTIKGVNDVVNDVQISS
jgi:hypothetical protein